MRNSKMEHTLLKLGQHRLNWQNPLPRWVGGSKKVASFFSAHLNFRARLETHKSQTELIKIRRRQDPCSCPLSWSGITLIFIAQASWFSCPLQCVPGSNKEHKIRGHLLQSQWNMEHFSWRDASSKKQHSISRYIWYFTFWSIVLHWVSQQWRIQNFHSKGDKKEQMVLILSPSSNWMTSLHLVDVIQ